MYNAADQAQADLKITFKGWFQPAVALRFDIFGNLLPALAAAAFAGEVFLLWLRFFSMFEIEFERTQLEGIGLLKMPARHWLQTLKGQKMTSVRNTLLFGMVALLGAVCVFAQTSDKNAATNSKPNAHLKTKYDKSKDVTTVSLKTMALSSSMTKESTNVREVPQLDLDVYFTHPGQTRTAPARSLILKFRSRAKSPAFQEGQNVLVVVNDETALQMGKTGYTSRSETFYIDEFLAIDFPDEALSRIASAKSIRFYLGPREIKISNDQLEDFKTIISAMRS